MGEKQAEQVPEQILSEKIGMTKEVDPIKLSIEFRIKMLEQALKARAKGQDQFSDEVKEILAKKFDDEFEQARADLAEYEPGEDTPVVLVKLMDPAMLTDFNHRHVMILRMDQSLEARRAESKLKRESASWGVAGHRNVTVMGQEVPFSSAVVEFDGEKHTVAHNRVVKEYERLGWLDALVGAINDHNTLSVQKKRP